MSDEPVKKGQSVLDSCEESKLRKHVSVLIRVPSSQSISYSATKEYQKMGIFF